jgi:ATP-dependent protease HslVU (ClpYQ) ATPase subunit
VSSPLEDEKQFKVKKQLNTTEEWLEHTKDTLHQFEEFKAVEEARMKMHMEKAVERAKIAVHMKRSVAYGQDTGDCVLSQQESEEVDMILHLWKRDLSYSTENYGFFITKIERICNSYLEEKYETTRRRFQRDGKPLTEELCFHGTQAPETVEMYFHVQNTNYSIVIEGFKVGGVNGQYMQHGNQLVPPIPRN